MQLKFNENWEGGVENPPFTIDNASAGEFLRAILDSAVGTPPKNAKRERAFAPHPGLPAVYILFASIYFRQRVPAPSTNVLKHLANFVTRKGGGKGSVQKKAGSLLEAFRVSINQRRSDPQLSGLTAAEAKQQLLPSWDAIAFESSIFEEIAVSLSMSSSAHAAAISAGSGGSSVEHTCTGSHGQGDGLGNTLGGGSRDQPQEAGTCTGSSPSATYAEVQVAADRGSNSIAAGAASATPSPA
eukprot:130724-Pleurochrysis_carterae.AAC.1